MNKQLKNIGIAAIVVGALAYPALKLYQYLAKRRTEGNENDAEKATKKTLRLLNHTKHMPHHQAAHNGHANPSVG